MNELELKRMGGKPLSGKALAKVQAALLSDKALWRRVGDLDGEVRTKALAVLEEDSVKYESALAGIRAMRAGLLRDGGSDLEQIAAEQILTCWVQTAVSGVRLECLGPGRETGRDARFWERRHEQAQGRLLRSMDLMARLRRLRLVGLVEPEDGRRLVIEIDRRSDADRASGKQMAQVSTVRKVEPESRSEYDEVEILQYVNDPRVKWD